MTQTASEIIDFHESQAEATRLLRFVSLCPSRDTTSPGARGRGRPIHMFQKRKGVGLVSGLVGTVGTLGVIL